jgi:hypothetical protein
MHSPFISKIAWRAKFPDAPAEDRSVYWRNGINELDAGMRNQKSYVLTDSLLEE